MLKLSTKLTFTIIPIVLTVLPSALSKFSWNDSPSVSWAMNCDFLKGDIGDILVSADQCSNACSNFPSCSHFSWTTFNGGTCKFKHQSRITIGSAIVNNAPGAFCGILKGSTQPPVEEPLPPPSWKLLSRVGKSVTRTDNFRGERSGYSDRQTAPWKLFSRVGKSVTRTAKFSEEGSGYSGRQTAPIAGLSCSGSYCDDKELVVVRDGSASPVKDSAYWTGWISEENPSSAHCPSDMIVNEVQCDGRYCDNLRLECGRLHDDYRVDSGDIKTVDWFSEEEGERLCPDGYYFWGITCRDRYCDNVKLDCARIDYKHSTSNSEKNVVTDSLKFAPVFYFDGKGPENCLPDWPSSENNNNCRKSFLKNSPTFVEYDLCDIFEVYTFWLWYGDQNGCIVFDDGHGDDWEHVSVFVRDGQVQKVTFFQHKGWYTRKRGTFGMSGERTHVYVGKVGHGSYHAECDGVCGISEFFGKGCLGSVNYCQGGCGYWDDFRNPGPGLSGYKVYELHPGKTIDGITRPDRDVCVSSCSGSGSRLLTTAGCWQNNV